MPTATQREKTDYRLRATREYQNYIDGQWVESSGGKTFENINPADGDDVIGMFQESTADDLNAAVDAADRAYKTWRLVPAPKRAEYLSAAAAVLKRDKEKIAREMTREMGKVLDETRGDVQEAIDMTYLMAGEGRRLFGVTTPSELPSKFNMAVRMPLGVAGLITPWNFPIAIPAWKTMPALVCGNTVVIKPASLTPLSVVMLAEAFEEVGLPPGVFNVVTGGGKEVGQPMLEHPKVSVISFTGSTDVGRDIAVACAPQFKHVHLEMGGKNVILVMDDADIDLAVDGALWGAFGTAGGGTLTDGNLAEGHFHQPTVFADVTPNMRIAQEEIFGPVTAVMRCDSLDEAIAIGNGVKYGLSSSIYTRDVNNAFLAMRDMYTGIFYVNAPTIGAETHLPFGGVKETGNGHREAGVAGIDVFTEWKSIYVDYSGSLQRAQIDTEEV